MVEIQERSNRWLIKISDDEYTRFEIGKDRTLYITVKERPFDDNSEVVESAGELLDSIENLKGSLSGVVDDA